MESTGIGRGTVSDVLLLGRNGFLGSALVPYCQGDKTAPVWINAMARVMGIEGNRKFPAYLLADNLKSAMDVLDRAVDVGCRRVVNFGSTCAYSPTLPTPFSPNDYLSGVPEMTNYAYAMAKRTIFALSEAYNDEHDMENLYLVMPNLYGPGCKFGPNEHVIPNLIEKFQIALDVGSDSVHCLGTGLAEREFLYIDDAAKLVMQAIDVPLPTNFLHLTSGTLVTIQSLAKMIATLMGYKGDIVWTAYGPDGQMKRQLEKGLELANPTDFSVGLQNTIDYYRRENSYASTHLLPTSMGRPDDGK